MVGGIGSWRKDYRARSFFRFESSEQTRSKTQNRVLASEFKSELSMKRASLRGAF